MFGTNHDAVLIYNYNSLKQYTLKDSVGGTTVRAIIEDKTGNIWFSAENYGVFRYNGKEFTQFTMKNGLATNTIQSIYYDGKGQIWFSTWKGISLYDGTEITDAADKEPWIK